MIQNSQYIYERSQYTDCKCKVSYHRRVYYTKMFIIYIKSAEHLLIEQTVLLIASSNNGKLGKRCISWQIYYKIVQFLGLPRIRFQLQNYGPNKCNMVLITNSHYNFLLSVILPLRTSIHTQDSDECQNIDCSYIELENFRALICIAFFEQNFQNRFHLEDFKI